MRELGRSTQVRRIAVIVFLAVGFIFVVGYLQGPRHAEAETYELIIAFPHSGGTTVGSPVVFKGKMIGCVAELLPQQNGSIHVMVVIDARVDISRSHIPTIVSIATDRRTEASLIVFEEALKNELALLYGDDFASFEVPYGNGDYLPFGRVMMKTSPASGDASRGVR